MKIIVFKNGNTREITGEAGKYWMTGDDRVRKLSQEISEIREIEVPEPIVIELKTTPPAKLSGDVTVGKKPSSRKKKKAAEVSEDGDSGE